MKSFISSFNIHCNKISWTFLLALILAACKPVIYSFSASPGIVSENDSIHLKWKARGTPGITFHQKKIRYFGTDSLQLLQFILVSTKGAGSYVRRPLEIVVLPNLYCDTLILPVGSRQGDTLVATGIRDSLYQHFKIDSIVSLNSRKMIVQHGVYETMLYDSNVRSKTFRSLEYAGPWKLQSVLTPAEKENPKLVPEQLMIAVFIKLSKS
jgi:hypothetical protein